MANTEASEIPQLEGWMTLPDAARELGITRSRIHQLVDAKTLKSTRKIGSLKIVRTVEVEERKAEQELARKRAAERGETVQEEEVPA